MVQHTQKVRANVLNFLSFWLRSQSSMSSVDVVSVSPSPPEDRLSVCLQQTQLVNAACQMGRPKRVYSCKSNETKIRIVIRHCQKWCKCGEQHKRLGIAFIPVMFSEISGFCFQSKKEESTINFIRFWINSSHITKEEASDTIKQKRTKSPEPTTSPTSKKGKAGIVNPANNKKCSIKQPEWWRRERSETTAWTTQEKSVSTVSENKRQTAKNSWVTEKSFKVFGESFFHTQKRKVSKFTNWRSLGKTNKSVFCFAENKGLQRQRHLWQNGGSQGTDIEWLHNCWPCQIFEDQSETFVSFIWKKEEKFQWNLQSDPWRQNECPQSLLQPSSFNWSAKQEAQRQTFHEDDN